LVASNHLLNGLAFISARLPRPNFSWKFDCVSQRCGYVRVRDGYRANGRLTDGRLAAEDLVRAWEQWLVVCRNKRARYSGLFYCFSN
jgi:hypothetical protein